MLTSYPTNQAKLGISGVQSDVCVWKGERTQIDLLIYRRDQVINLCEIKYSQSEFEITKQYDQHSRERLEAFRTVTKTKKHCIKHLLRHTD